MKLFSYHYFIVFLKGILMGIADVIPGVSGGTIALITGVYQELIDTINNLNISKFKLLIHFKYREFWISINGNFIL